MNRFEKISERDRVRHKLPLIMPMLGSLNRVIDSNSPWVATDPVLVRECLAVYRSVRLVLLALIALVSGPRRVQAEESNGECQWQVATAHFGANQAKNSGSLRQSSALYETVQARIDHFASLVSEAPIEVDGNCGAWTLALDAPKQQSHSRGRAQAHAPPFSLILMNLDAPNFDCSITLPQSAARHANTLFPSVPYPPSSQNDCLIAAVLQLPIRQSLHLDVIRAHAPPVQQQLLDFKAFPVHPSIAISASSDFVSVASPASIDLALPKFRSPHSYLPPVLQLSYHAYSASCQRNFSEGASFRAVSLLVSTQPNQLKGGHHYVCQ
jgi:hypothetical protein